MRPSALALACLLAGDALAAPQEIAWDRVQAEAVALLQQYVRIDTSNPPGNVTKAADLLQSVLQREGIPVQRYESGPGRSIIVARLRASRFGAAGSRIIRCRR